MLVLTRKYQEKIRIGENITVTVLRSKGKAIRLGIEAPSDVAVLRGELAFDETSPQGAAESANANPTEAAPGTASGTKRPGRGVILRPETAWPGSSPARSENGKSLDPTSRNVTLRRVARDKVSQVLPQLAAGHSPLRAMIDERSATV